VRTPCSRTKPAYATTILVIDARKNVPMPAPGAAGDVNNTANGNRKGKKPIRTKAVEIMRAVEAELKAFQPTAEGKPKLIATHGNRFVLHILFRSGVDVRNSDSDATRKQIPAVVKQAVNGLIAATTKAYADAYPSNLFKNLSKCKELEKEMFRPSSIFG